MPSGRHIETQISRLTALVAEVAAATQQLDVNVERPPLGGAVPVACPACGATALLSASGLAAGCDLPHGDLPNRREAPAHAPDPPTP